MFGKEFRFDFETVKRCIEGCLQCCLEGFKTVKRVGNFTLSKCFRKENINQEIFGWWGAIFANFLALIGLLATILVIATFVRLIWNQKTLKKYLPISCIHQRHILITGCDYGFGFELACRLDKLGCPVFATCLTESGLKNILRNCSSRVQVLLLDVTRKETINAAFEIVSDVLKKKDKKGLWAIVNNAGIPSYGDMIEWSSFRDMKKVSDVNLWGMVAVTKTFLPLLKETQGRIVNIASIAGKFAPAGTMSYCISKFGVEAFSDSLRLEMLNWSISVHIIEPGMFKTNLTSRSTIEAHFKRKWDQLDQTTRDEYGEEYLKSVIGVTTKATTICSSALHKVVGCLEHAILAVNPRKRYYAGWDSALFFSWFVLLPAEVTDNFFFLIGKLRRQPLPKAVAGKKY